MSVRRVKAPSLNWVNAQEDTKHLEHKPWFATFDFQKFEILKPSGFGRSGGNGEDETPDPIPNSAVKSLSADGTVSQDAGE
jgi:hypothetical protein